nr:MAG TPA: leucine rich repeat protein [Caudoviricetes sp.]
MNIQDIINEVNSIQSRKEAIKEAINSKGVTSEGKLSKFADEIKKIKGFPYSDTMLVAISNAIGLGLTDEEVTKDIAEFTTNNVEINFSDTSIPVNKYKNNKTIKPIHTYFRVNTIGNYAFNGSNLRKLTSPLTTKIGPMTFENCSELEELNLGSFVYKSGFDTSFSLKNCHKFKKLIVSENSNITMSDYRDKLAVANNTFEIYTYSGKKYNKLTYRFE